MNGHDFQTVFPMGTHLCREPMPSMREMKRDMALVRAQGFNMIKLQENWMLVEPRQGSAARSTATPPFSARTTARRRR